MKIGIEETTTVKTRYLNGQIKGTDTVCRIYVSKFFGLWKRYIHFYTIARDITDIGDVSFGFVDFRVATPLSRKRAEKIVKDMTENPTKYYYVV